MSADKLKQLMSANDSVHIAVLCKSYNFRFIRFI